MLAFNPLTVDGPIYGLIERAVAATQDTVESIKKIGGGLEEISHPGETLHENITRMRPDVGMAVQKCNADAEMQHNPVPTKNASLKSHATT